MRSDKASASGPFIDEQGLGLCHHRRDRIRSVSRRPVRLLRAKQDPVSPPRLAGVARRARRSLLLSGGRRARPRRARVCGRELRLTSTSFCPRRYSTYSINCVCVAQRFRADEQPAVHSTRRAARGDRVPAAPRRPAVSGQLRRVSPHDSPRAGARLPAEPHVPDVQPLSALPAGWPAAVVDRRARGILLGRRGQPRRDGAAGHDDRGPSPHAPRSHVRVRRARVSRRGQHPPVSGGALRRMARARAVQRHVEILELR